MALRQSSALRAILEQVGRLDGLLRDLLAMTQREPAALAEVDLRALLGRAVESHRRSRRSARGSRSGSSRSRRQRRSPPWTPTKSAGASDNLILNAIQNTPPGGSIALVANRRGQAYRLASSTQGPGSRRHPRTHVRAIRHRATGRHRARTRHRARDRAGHTAGTLRFVSSQRGARFRIEMPWQQILIVDDDAGASRRSRRDGRATSATRPVAAAGREASRVSRPSTDRCRAARSADAGRHRRDRGAARAFAAAAPPPVAVLTAYASADNTIEAMRLGAFDHLTKPIGRDELRTLLDRMLAGAARQVDDAPKRPPTRADRRSSATSEGDAARCRS